MRRVLLVEPAHGGRFPPLGLMKLSTYHKMKGDFVRFVRGTDRDVISDRWDRIYVSSLFTYTWDVTVRTILHYRECVDQTSDVVVGGVLATLLAEELRQVTGARVIEGLLDKPGVLDAGDTCCIDRLMPDYAILNDVDFAYRPADAYIGYTTRGCPNNCPFCAVGRLEPDFMEYVPLKRQVRAIEQVFGPKQDLILMDNNVLASRELERIVSEIEDLGFFSGARLDGRLRRVDFNQGLDIHFFNERAASLLSRLAIKPVRMAFDWLHLKDLFSERIAIAAEYGLTTVSTYVLYNYKDTPADFYERLKVGVEVGKQYGVSLSGFPMKYIPLDAKDRSHVGEHWNRRLLRGVQCILAATRGMVSTNIDFFNAAFGESAEEFIEIAMMPDEYIIHRGKHAEGRAAEWRRVYRRLTVSEAKIFSEVIGPNSRLTRDAADDTLPKRVRELVKHYDSPE